MRAAEKRWNDDLMARFGSDASVYGAIVEGTTLQMQEEATKAELERRGAGLSYLIKALAGLAPL